MTIKDIITHSIDPVQWRVTKLESDQSNMLEVSHDPALSNSSWYVIRTARGLIKNYKTLDSLFSDIQKVQSNSTVRYLTCNDTND